MAELEYISKEVEGLIKIDDTDIQAQFDNWISLKNRNSSNLNQNFLQSSIISKITQPNDIVTTPCFDRSGYDRGSGHDRSTFDRGCISK